MAEEAKIVAAISAKVLKPLRPNLWFFKVHGGPFQRAGIPDFVGCYKGRFFAIEVKQPGKVPTPLQVIVMRELKEAGAAVCVATSVAEAQELIMALHNSLA